MFSVFCVFDSIAVENTFLWIGLANVVFSVFCVFDSIAIENIFLWIGLANVVFSVFCVFDPNSCRKYPFMDRTYKCCVFCVLCVQSVT